MKHQALWLTENLPIMYYYFILFLIQTELCEMLFMSTYGCNFIIFSHFECTSTLALCNFPDKEDSFGLPNTT